jgi:DNA-binding MarR family transcriptional regulator
MAQPARSIYRRLRKTEIEQLSAAALPSGMAKVEPLNSQEELFWRAFMRIVLTLPRHLDRDLVQAAGVTANEYTTIMNLSEAPNREMRMADLANATGLSPSRITRLVDDLVARGFVIKRASSVDGRGNIAKLTPKGMAKLKAAWPAHLASVRDRVFDQLDPKAIESAAIVLDALATNVEARNANSSGHP